MSTGVFNKTVGDVIRQALRISTISGIELPIQPNHFTEASSLLNNLLASLQTKQIHLWSETEAVLPLNPAQQKYTLGVGGDHCFTDYKYTTVSVIALSGATSLTVASTSGMTAGDHIGIELDNGTRQWATITTVNSSTGLTIPALTDDVAVGATVYTYTTGIDMPVRILDARYSDNYDTDEIPTSQISRKEYYDQPSKYSQGAINSWYYSRQLENGFLNVWPVASNVNQLLKFTFIKPQYVPEDQSENILVPPEWYNAITWQLAGDLGVMYNIDANKQVFIEQKAQIYLADALSTDTDFSSIQFQPE